MSRQWSDVVQSGRLCLVAGVVVCLLGLPASAAALQNYTWTGNDTQTGSASGLSWSNGGNWVGGSAPRGAVGTLSFPALASCPGLPCYPLDDLVGGAAVSASGISIDDSVGYQFGYEVIGGVQARLTLGDGGITAFGANHGGESDISVPIELAAPQTWTVQGYALGLHAVTGGAGDNVSIRFTGATRRGEPNLVLHANVAAGAVSAHGVGEIALDSGTSLNATNGNPVSLSGGADLVAANSTVGPLTSTGGRLGVVRKLSVRGPVTFDSASSIGWKVYRRGRKPGSDYSQLVASGNVNLGGAKLYVKGGSPAGICPRLHVGDVETLVRTTGRLTGRFAGIPNGSKYGLICQPPPQTPACESRTRHIP